MISKIEVAICSKQIKQRCSFNLIYYSLDFDFDLF